MIDCIGYIYKTRKIGNTAHNWYIYIKILNTINVNSADDFGRGVGKLKKKEMKK